MHSDISLIQCAKLKNFTEYKIDITDISQLQK